MKKLTIWHTNDVHSRFEGFIGMAGHIRKYAGPDDLILDSGDFADMISVMVSGTEGLGAMRLLKAAGFDAMAVGNNEFFEGIDTLSRMADAFPMMACNITDLQGRPVPNIIPYKLLERSGIRVLLIGACPFFRGTQFFTDNAGVKLHDPAPMVSAILEKEKGNYDICILLSHLGLWHDTELVEKVQGIDLILGGHSHTEMSEPQIVNGTVIFHSGLHSKMLGRVEIILDEADGTEKSGRRSVTINAENITGACEPYAELESVLAEETAKGIKTLSEPLFEISRELAFDAFSECPACNMVADSLKSEYGGDFALINNGIICRGFSGTVTKLSLLETSPSILNPTMVWWKGRNIREALAASFDQSFIRQSGRGPGSRSEVLGALAVSSNVIVRKPQSGALPEVFVDGKPLEDGNIYCVMTDDYMYRGKAGYTMLSGSEKQEIYYDGYIRDMLEKTLRSQSLTDGAFTKRIG